MAVLGMHGDRHGTCRGEIPGQRKAAQCAAVRVEAERSRSSAVTPVPNTSWPGNGRGQKPRRGRPRGQRRPPARSSSFPRKRGIAARCEAWASARRGTSPGPGAGHADDVALADAMPSWPGRRSSRCSLVAAASRRRRGSILPSDGLARGCTRGSVDVVRHEQDQQQGASRQSPESAGAAGRHRRPRAPHPSSSAAPADQHRRRAGAVARTSRCARRIDELYSSENPMIASACDRSRPLSCRAGWH